MSLKKINAALISVYNKENLEPIIKTLNANNIKIYSTGGTQKFIQDMGVSVIGVEAVSYTHLTLPTNREV